MTSHHITYTDGKRGSQEIEIEWDRDSDRDEDTEDTVDTEQHIQR